MVNGTGILVVGGSGPMAEETLRQLLPHAPGAARVLPERGPSAPVFAIVATVASGERASLCVSITRRAYPGVPVVVYAEGLGTLEAIQLTRLPQTEVVLVEETIEALVAALARALPLAAANPTRPGEAMGARLRAAVANPVSVTETSVRSPGTRPPVQAQRVGVPRGADELPMIDCRASKVQRLIAKDDCSVGDVEAVIATEPTLVTAVLRTANSAFYQSPRPITNLRDAIVRVGVRQTLNRALETLIQRSFQIVHPEGRSVLVGSWANAGLTAQFARRLADGDGLGRGDDIYLAALLHNIGECLLVWRMYRTPVQPGQLAAESPRIAAQHECAAEACLEKWGMPPLVASLAAFHHRPRHAENPREAALRRAITGSWALARRLQGDYLPNMAPIDPHTEFPLAIARRLVVQAAPELGKHPYLEDAPPTAADSPPA